MAKITNKIPIEVCTRTQKIAVQTVFGTFLFFRTKILSDQSCRSITHTNRRQNCENYDSPTNAISGNRFISKMRKNRHQTHKTRRLNRKLQNSRRSNFINFQIKSASNFQCFGEYQFVFRRNKARAA